VDKWEGIIILINEILGKVMWIKMGINAGEMRARVFDYMKLEIGNGIGGVWAKVIPLRHRDLSGC